MGAGADFDAADLIDGHCETVAAVLSEAILREAQLSNSGTPRKVLRASYANLAAELTAATVRGQVELLFGPERRGWAVPEGAGRCTAARAPALGDRRRLGIWEVGLAGGTIEPSAGVSWLESLLVGFDPGLPGRIAATAVSGLTPTTLPPYILNYSKA